MKRVFNVVRYLLLFVLNIFVMMVFHSYLNFILFVGMALFPIYSFYFTWKLSKKIELSIKMPGEPLKKNDIFLFRIQISNPMWHALANANVKLAFLNPFYGHGREHVFNVPIRAKQTAEFVYPIAMRYCGCVTVKVSEIRLMDLLGIFVVKKKVSIEENCLIFPQGRPLEVMEEKNVKDGVSEADESKTKGYDQTEVNGIREYILGDNLKDIHWKLSAKNEDWLVKERENLSSTEIYLLLDLYNDKNMHLEAVLELLESVTCYLVEQNLQFTLFYYSKNQGGICAYNIENEVMRRQWFEMLFYDHCDDVAGNASQMFEQQYSKDKTYLYIGYDEIQQKECCVLHNSL